MIWLELRGPGIEGREEGFGEGEFGHDAVLGEVGVGFCVLTPEGFRAHCNLCWLRRLFHESNDNAKAGRDGAKITVSMNFS